MELKQKVDPSYFHCCLCLGVATPLLTARRPLEVTFVSADISPESQTLRSLISDCRVPLCLESLCASARATRKSRAPPSPHFRASVDCPSFGFCGDKYLQGDAVGQRILFQRQETQFGDVTKIDTSSKIQN